MKTVRVGLGIGSQSARIVVLRGDSMAFCAERQLSGPAEITLAIGELLRQASIPRWPRASVIAALGPSIAPTTELRNLPSSANLRSLSRAIRENQERFFLKNGTPMVTSNVTRFGESLVAAAAASQVIHAIQQGCREGQSSLRAILPVAAVLRDELHKNGHVWHDGCYSVHVSPAPGSLSPRQLNRVAGTNENAFADALAAARFTGRPGLALAMPSDAAGSRTLRARRVAALSICLLSFSVMLASPGLAAKRAARAASHRLSGLADEYRRFALTQHRVREVSLELSELAEFEARRRSMTGTLALITAALPAGAALSMFRADSIGVSLVVVGARPSVLLGKLESMGGISGVEVVGPVTREIVGGREVERATIRFRFARS